MLGRIRIEMKKCPYCAEEIQDEAVKCKHCHEFLDESMRPAPVGPPPLPGSSLPWYFRTGFIVLTFMMVPPFALPPVWFHPKLHWAWKVAITVVIVAITWYSIVLYKAFASQYDEAIKMLDQGFGL